MDGELIKALSPVGCGDPAIYKISVQELVSQIAFAPDRKTATKPKIQEVSRDS